MSTESELGKIIVETIKKSIRTNDYLFIREWAPEVGGGMILDGVLSEDAQESMAKEIVGALKAAGVQL